MGKSHFNLVGIVLFLWLSVFIHSSYSKRTPMIFNFGDSNSATSVASFPNGRAFFPLHHERASDGRLIIDFLCESVNTSYLIPEGVGVQNFSNGANFAIGASYAYRGEPFWVKQWLKMQTDRFIQFRNQSLEQSSNGANGLPNKEDFETGLYTIDIGQNDMHGSYWQPYKGIVRNITRLYIPAIKDAIQTIYAHGGRNFWVHGTGPLGCLPEHLYLYKIFNNNKDPFHYNKTDNHGCLVYQNEGCKEFNKQLSALCEQLRSELKNVTIVYVDIFSIKYDIITNAAKYGFEKPLQACMGFGGPPYNYNSELAKQKKGFNVCSPAEASKRISWDGVHYTEALNKMVASRILSTYYSTPKLNWDHFFSS